MYNVAVTTSPSGEPVTLQELKDFLRINTTDEDTILSGFISAARQQFEFRTGRPVLSTVYRQYLSELNPCVSYRGWTAPYGRGPGITLVKGGVTSVTALSYYDIANTLQVASGYEIDATATPVRLWFTGTVPSVSSTKSPVGYVDFVAGWATASAVPEGVKLAIKLLAAHYYEHRSEASEVSLAAVPFGFGAVCDQYRTGLQGYYGEAR